MHIGADVSLLLNDGHVELEDDDHDALEDDDHDVIDVIEDDDHDVIDVISPLSFKVEMNNLMVSSMMLNDLMMVMRMTKM